MHKIAKRVEELSPAPAAAGSKPPPFAPAAAAAARRQCILVRSGAYNPIHKLHLRSLYIARKYLEERAGLEVLGGLVSPHHATEVRSRFRTTACEIVPPRHRLAMARLAAGESTWVTVDPWEVTRRRVMDYLSVLDHVRHLAEACFPAGGVGAAVKVIYLCSPEVQRANPAAPQAG